MSKPDDYRRHAAQTISLAARADAASDKAHLLELAERWLDLADAVAKRARRQAWEARHWANEFTSRSH